ncbi:MAG: 30S ribosomal protein S3 [Clostridia bacterium]|nr:30S ribosomal protein S3 [Clostridia bacterium]
MGQKVNPRGLRIGVIEDWNTQWYANKNSFATYLKEDNDIRKYINKNYSNFEISKVVIERNGKKLTVKIFSGRSASLIGSKEKGSNVDKIKADITKMVNPNKANKNDNRVEKEISVDVYEVKKPDMDAQIVAERIARGLEDRNNSYKKVMRQAMAKAMRAGAKGIKTKLSGRINGVEQACSETYIEKSVPLQTLRAEVDYGFDEAHTTYGLLGVKVWIYKGEVFTKSRKEGGND